MKTSLKPRQLTLLGLLTALLLVLSLTPLGYLRIGPLSASLNMIPVAVAAIALGPTGGAITGAVFGLTSFAQAMGGGSALMAVLMSISPVLTFVLCFVPRLGMGLLVGLLSLALRKATNTTVRSCIVGFCAAFFNTVFFMGALVLLFGNTAYMQELMGGRNVIVFICAFVGANAVFEMLASTLIVGVLGKTLEKAHLIGRK